MTLYDDVKQSQWTLAIFMSTQSLPKHIISEGVPLQMLSGLSQSNYVVARNRGSHSWDVQKILSPNSDIIQIIFISRCESMLLGQTIFPAYPDALCVVFLPLMFSLSPTGREEKLEPAEKDSRNLLAWNRFEREGKMSPTSSSFKLCITWTPQPIVGVLWQICCCRSFFPNMEDHGKFQKPLINWYFPHVVLFLTTSCFFVRIQIHIYMCPSSSESVIHKDGIWYAKNKYVKDGWQRLFRGTNIKSSTRKVCATWYHVSRHGKCE